MSTTQRTSSSSARASSVSLSASRSAVDSVAPFRSLQREEHHVLGACDVEIGHGF
ncbi:MAG: hypothetical protein R2690_07305 [Acidimicrobiales bacterium]